MDTQAAHNQLLRRIRQAMQSEDYLAAVDALEQAVQITQQTGDSNGETLHLGNLAQMYYRVGQFDEALDCFSRALDLARANNDSLTESGLLGNMGNILREVGLYDDAQECLNRALELAQAVGDVRGQGVWLFNLGLLHSDLKRSEAAITALQMAVQIARILRDQRGLMQRLTQLVNMTLQAGEPAEAVKGLQELAALHRNLGEPINAATQLTTLGDLHHHMATQAGTEFEAGLYFSLALDSYREAYSLLVDQDALPAQAETLFSIASLHGNMGAFQPAADNFSAAYTLFEQAGLPERMSAALEQLQLAQSYLARS